jgi:hypothetical protein
MPFERAGKVDAGEAASGYLIPCFHILPELILASFTSFAGQDQKRRLEVGGVLHEFINS